eukprot:Sspe_Gene.20677::Locus_7610_Transcript_1_1_Confidence_1.000_Length_1145::g.20677::m.20677
MTLCTKGCGRTPFSRDLDGRFTAVGAVRELIGAEVVARLGGPTSRVLCAGMAPGVVVRRDRRGLEPCGAVLRAAPSWVRIGSIEYHAARGNMAAVRELLDWLIAHFSPPGTTYPAWFDSLVCRFARTMAWCQVYGFCHGVLNSDNLSVHGLLIDYGPYAFLDHLDPDFVANPADDEDGRYAFGKQPSAVLWSLEKLESILAPL